MLNVKLLLLFLFLPLFLILISCSNNKVLNMKNDKGEFSKSKSEVMKSTYENKGTIGFFFNIDFDLKEGKVDWEITNPKGEVALKGYAINENGRTYRQLTYPTNFNEELNKKQQVKSDKDGNGNIKPDFQCLLFREVYPLGKYTLSLRPTNVEGKYTVLWSDGMVTQ